MDETPKPLCTERNSTDAADLCSVVIPTLNEGPWLARSLDELRRIPNVAEIIVADGGSVDATVAIAQRYGCRIVSGGSPARGRNIGAAQAERELILFADADAVVTVDALTAGIKLIHRYDLVAVFFPLRPLSSFRADRLAYGIVDFYLRMMACLGMPQGLGSCMLVRKSAFIRIAGFDEGIRVSEDLEISNRLRQVGQAALAKNTWVWVSARRLRMENPWVFGAKCLLWATLRLLRLRTSGIAYRWVRYPEEIATDEAAYLKKITNLPNRRDA